MRKLLFATASLVSMASALPAHGATLAWTLSGVTFSDGGTASGTFSTDSTTGQLLSYNIATTAGTILGAFTYDASSSFKYGDNIFGPNSFIITNNSPFAQPYLMLSFVSPLTSGGTNALQAESSYECMNCIPYRTVVSGFATTGAVPEPSAWALLILGFGAVGAGMRQRKTRIAFA